MIFRWLFGLPAAALVTVFLFIFMHGMISQDAEAGPMTPPPAISILPKLTLTPPTKTKTVRPEPVVQPDPIIPDTIEKQPVPKGDTFELPPTRKTVMPVIVPGGMKPTVRIPPTYPENCRAKGAQGVVIVEFDITADGAVVNPRIISSPNSCFDRAVMKTMLRWRYAPKMVDGRPTPQRGVREAFNFQLTD
ncbi:MAG: energy transducer TonB [Parvularculaceae bacterium]